MQSTDICGNSNGSVGMSFNPCSCVEWEITIAFLLNNTYIYSITDQISEKLDTISKTLGNMGLSLEKISRSVEKPKENKFLRILELLVLVGSASAIIGGIDIIRNWF